ncbi:hypothetical protein MMC12_005958 [Toensbergia leucococca]|nr:hypothetical protein [Toensbergia leucococca]
MSSSPKYTTKLAQSRVLILGGTSGIGFCVAEAALEHGAQVTISGSKPPKLEHALSRLKASYPDKTHQLSGHTCDLSRRDSLEANLDALLQAAAGDSRIDHIVFTAGDNLKVTPIAEATIQDILQPGQVRFLGPFVLAKLAPRYLSPSSKSSITVTSGSINAKPAKDWAIVAAWSAAMEGMTRGLAVDLAPVRVNCVSPGAVHTELFDDLPEGVLQFFRDGTLAGQMGRPEDLAEAFLYAMKDQFLTGSVIDSNGGRLLK